MKIKQCGKIYGRVLFCIFAALFISFFSLIQGKPVQASTDQIMRVGFFAFDGYHNMDEDGCRSGYGYEFIQKLLRYNNYTAQYVGYDKNWSEMQRMLENGEIDILTSAQKTPAREEKFDFSEPIGTSAAILTVKAGNEKFVAGEYRTYQDMKVGVIEGNSRNERFQEFAEEHGFTYTLNYYDDMDALQADLQNDKIDAIVTSNLRSIDHEWVLDRFATSPFYAMVKKGNNGLLHTVNYAIDQMNSIDVGWQEELFNKYYAGDSGESIALSSTERTYIAALKSSGRKIKVLVHPDRAPYSYVENGQAQGIIKDVFEEVAHRLKLPYEYIICNTRQEYAELKKGGVADVLLEARNDLSKYEDMGYKLTDPYMNMSYASVELSSFSGEPATVANIKEAYTSDENFNNLIEGKNVLYFDNLRQCVDAVLDGRADVCYMYDYSGQKFASENVRGNLQSTTIPDLKDSLTFGVLASDDYRLLTVLNKGVGSVLDNYVDTAIKRNTDFSLGKLTAIQILWRNPQILMILVVFAAAVAISLIYGYQKRKSETRVQDKNQELERFIGYICKSNSSVREVNFTTGKEKEYILDQGHIRLQEGDYQFMDPEHIHSKILDEDFAEIDKSVNTSNIGDIIEQAEDKYFECRLKEDAGYHWYAITMMPIPRDHDHPNNVLIFKRDIDEAKRKEEETKQSLKEALEAANQASESKGSFLSNMSHEIRTPLNAIIGYLTLAKDKDVSVEKLAHCIDNCDIASRHLLQIINDILDMSSIESGKLKIAHEDFDLKKEISDITTIFFQNAKAKDIQFETFVDGLTEEWVNGDQLRLNQVLMNLLSNAVKFTPEHGNVQLRITQIRDDDKKVYIKFEVVDNGIGMSEEYMSRIFTPFEQENAGTAKKFGGSGLGLSITNNLVKMMCGNISVSSRQNEGTAFTVTMYFGKAAEGHENAYGNMDYSHVRVLVVDDREDEGTYVKAMLKRCGVKSDFVTSGENALRRIKSRMGGDYSYDLCIIDWNMPEMDGCEVTRRIRKEIGLEVPVIIATAYDVTEFQDEAKSVGVNKIVSKPLFQSTLFDLLVSTFGNYDPNQNVAQEKERIDMSGVHVLLAEDNPMNMDIAVTILEKAGIVVDQAVNGEEAYHIFTSKEAGTYDLILMDVQMPVMDGYQATRAIRSSEHPEAKTIPVIAMTANAFAEDVADALSNGMNAHIAKPINYDKLFELLKRYRRA